ncbi:MAG: hypothetical protein B7Y80_20110 [Hyphomicrobium sp. 32-62-53]|nr:MAG: hypothetical protein B7Z29_19940 [Hyphomicrobium sp. 12-62-95]OYX97338.1 MAG: hypothetical protein B7Y80_20110 [Hyphomicrobium sp. 32-62-53]
MAQVIVFPLQREQSLCPTQAAHVLGQIEDPAARKRCWQDWATKTKKRLVKKGVPKTAASHAIHKYAMAIREEAFRLGYLRREAFNRDRAS